MVKSIEVILKKLILGEETKFTIGCVLLLVIGISLLFSGGNIVSTCFSVFILFLYIAWGQVAEFIVAVILSGTFSVFYGSGLKLVKIWDISKLTKTVEFFHDLGFVRCIVFLLIVYSFISFFFHREED